MTLPSKSSEKMEAPLLVRSIQFIVGRDKIWSPGEGTKKATCSPRKLESLWNLLFIVVDFFTSTRTRTNKIMFSHQPNKHLNDEAIPFRLRKNSTSDLVSKLIGQTMLLLRLWLVTYLEKEWDRIERTSLIILNRVLRWIWGY